MMAYRQRRVGLISDTHGLLRPEAVEALRGSDEAIICVVHDLAQLDIDPAAAGFHAVVSGHSHRPAIQDRDGVLYANPGSAGPRRFSLPVSVGSLVVAGRRVRARLVTLDI